LELRRGEKGGNSYATRDDEKIKGAVEGKKGERKRLGRRTPR